MSQYDAKMIKRLNIPNFGSFSGFDWKSSVRRKGEVAEFKRLNILFGRNYSGKTTLSRILQSFEVGRFPRNYSGPEFEVFSDSAPLTQEDVSSPSPDIRVYNTDFVSENLSFLANENEGEIRPFAILGSGNKEIEIRLEEIEEELGDDERKTGKAFKLVQARDEHFKKEKKANKARDDLDEQLRRYANDKIKRNQKYRVVDYNINAIKADIETIESKSITVLETSDVYEKEQLLREESLPSIFARVSFKSNFKALFKDSAEILATEIRPSKSIEYLLADLSLQAWVREGMNLHSRDGDEELCGFCGQDLPEDFWEKLDAHFSKESSDLEKKIERQIGLLKKEIESLSSIDLPKKEGFYESVRSTYRDSVEKFDEVLESYMNEVQKLLEALEARQKDIFNSQLQPEFRDLSEEISDRIYELNGIVELNNQKTETLSEDQETARKDLRLNDVLSFINRIGYIDKRRDISDLERMATESEDGVKELKSQVRSLERERDNLQTELRDEQKGAEKVNEYLNHSFGLNSLSLLAEEDEVVSKYKFHIMRGNQPAYNMSEGERSLISFCYFLAKLEDTETQKEKSIIYIDDPVSSLDSNHIFFVFSLIESVLARPEKNQDHSNRYRYKQLFISTHNLDFLKYLKKLSAPRDNNGGTEFFLVEKEGTSSSLRLMPKYLKDYQTEFIYLFHQIYKCRKAEASEENHQMFYSLGNNLRKFLEAYLFYRYPYKEDSEDGFKKLRRFFGDDGESIALTNRIRHELSHLEGIMERGMRPIDMPELPKVASFVIDTIKEKDEEQYKSLLRSIGESP